MRVSGSIAMRLVVTIAALLSSVAPAAAEISLDIRGLGALSGAPSTAALRDAGPLFQSIPEISVSAYVAGIGPVEARFRSRRIKTWRSRLRGSDGRLVDDGSSPVLLQGEVSIGRGGQSRRAAASLIGGDLEVAFVAPSRRGGEKMVKIKARSARDGRVSGRASRVSLGAGAQSCGLKNDAHSHASSSLAAKEVGTAALLRRWDLVTVVEQTWISRFGSNANSRVASIVNTVDTLYREELGVTLNIVSQVDGSGLYTNSNASDTLLTNFANTSASQGFGVAFTSAALFTNRPLDPDGNGNHGTNGIAFLGAVCNTSFGYALMTARSPNIEQTTAHELGHNLNADHDSVRYSDKGATLMFPSSVPDRQFTFSNFSIGQMTSFLSSSNASCMATVDDSDDPSPPTPTPQPTSPPNVTVPSDDSILTLRKSPNGKNRFVLSGALFSNDGSSVFEGASVELYSNGNFVASTSTDADGFYAFAVRVRLKAGQRLVLRTAVTGTQILSKRVTIKKKKAKKKAKKKRARKIRGRIVTVAESPRAL